METRDGRDMFRWAAETDKPSEIVPAFVEWLLASPTPERVQQIRERVSDEGIGIVACGVAEELLGTTPTGEHDFKRFPARLKGLPEDFLQALFGAQGYQRLQDIAITSSVIVPASDNT